MTDDRYLPPPMTNGKSWADYEWWKGRHGGAAWDDQPANFDEAAALTWARCWAYIDEMGLTADECRIVWPIAYAALNACANITATEEPR